MTDETTGPDASGPKLSLNAPTPSQEMTRGVQPEVIPLNDGRKLHVRKPSVLAQYKILEALGPDLSANQTYVQMVMPLNYLGLIEDAEGARPVVFTNKMQIEGLISELGEVGMDALFLWFTTNVMGPQLDLIDAARAAAAEKAALKNG